MAEGLLEGVLGGEEEKIDPTVGGTEPIVAAVAANLASQNPEVAAKTAAMFEEQTQLLRLQRKNVEAEYEFFESEAGPRLLVLRLRAGFQLFFALFATVIGVGLAIVIYSATQSRSVVINSFEVPPSLAADGLNGKVVAAGLLDFLTKIQAASRGTIERRDLSNAWTSEISIEVPDTGVSIGDLERLIKTRFGHDQHIDGDLVRSVSGGLALTVRGDGILPSTFTGDAGALDNLLREAGEYLFAQSQPGLWMAYLSKNNRYGEAVAFAESAYNTVAPTERPHVLVYWANSIADMGGENAMTRALPLYREAVRLKPDFWPGHLGIMYALMCLGEEEGAVRAGEQMIRVAGGRPGRAPEDMYANYDSEVRDAQAELASSLADMEIHGGLGTWGTTSSGENLVIASLEIDLHDVAAATLRLKTTSNENGVVPGVSAPMVRAKLAEETGDLKAAAVEWDAFSVTYANPTIAFSMPDGMCSAAVTYEKTGQPAKADAALKPYGDVKMVDCYRFKGDVLDLRGDWAGAQEWYAKAVTLGPSIPSGYFSWGLALAKHEDLAGAAEKFKLANEKGPHWADPLKAWGDVLMKQNNAKDALSKYDEALKYAPNWKQLKEARETAAKLKT